MEKKQIIVAFGLGSNIGDKLSYIEQAILALEEALGRQLKVSSMYESEPWGFASPENFINCCAYTTTDLSPEKLLSLTQMIEKKLGRVKKSQKSHYASRKIDIDILLYGSEVVHLEKLKIPHPLMYDRAFVMVPLSELLPDFVDPVKNKKIKDLKKLLNDLKTIKLYKKS